MKTNKKTLMLLIVFCFNLVLVNGQTSSSVENANPWQSIVGNLLKLEQTTNKVLIKTKNNQEISFEIAEKAVFLRINSQDKNLENAVKIKLSEILPGSQILARGMYSKDNVFVAQMLIVVGNSGASGRNIDSSKESIQGIVTEIDAVKKQIKAKVIGQTGVQERILDLSSSNPEFYLYANKSLKFSNSIIGSFDKLRVGDQIKAIGQTGTETSIFLTETIVSGTFRTFGGKIIAFDSAKNEILLEDLQSKKQLKIDLSQELKVRKLDKEKAENLIDTYFKNNNSTQEKKDLREFFDTLPLISQTELVSGDNVIISVVVGEDGNSLVGFYLLKDVSPVFNYLEKLQKKGKPLPNLGGLNL